MERFRKTKLLGKTWDVGCYAQYCWRRSANRGNANVWNVNASGNVNNNNPNNANRCAPGLRVITHTRPAHSVGDAF